MHISRTSRIAVLTVVAALAGAASIASSASAASQRYASATGSGAEPCTSASPCAIKQAVEAASSGDEVIVAPGVYKLTTDLYAQGITVRGVAGQPRPRLLLDNAAYMTLNGATLRYVEVVQAPGAQNIALSAWHASSVEQVELRGTAWPGYAAAFIQKSMIRNSLVVSPASEGTAILTVANGYPMSGTLRNVTAVATGSKGVAIRAMADYGGHASVLARNVIARGGPNGYSLSAETDNQGATATITVDHSNRQDVDTTGSKTSIVDGGDNQSAAPMFVSEADGDYRQAAGSPTIDAGLDEIISGPFDVEGDPRQIGGIDIGADEFFVAPAATTGPASAVTDDSATLTGSVNPNGASTAHYFEYGPTTAYGSSTLSAGSGSGTGAVAAKATVGGLSPATTYHYRLVANNSGVVTKGADRTFTTTAPTPPATTPPATTPPATTPPATTPPSARPFAGVRPVSTRLTMAGRFVTLKLSCPAATVGRCSGQTKLTARRPRTGSRPASRLTLGRAPFSIAAGKQARVRVRVSLAGRRLLNGGRRLRGKDTNAARDGMGQTKTTAAKVTIRRRTR